MKKIVFIVFLTILSVSGFAENKDAIDRIIKNDVIEKPKDEINYLSFISIFSLAVAVFSAFSAHRSASAAKKSIEFNQPIIYVKELRLYPGKVILVLANKGKSIGFVRKIRLNIMGKVILYEGAGDNDMILSDGQKEIALEFDEKENILHSLLSELNGEGYVLYDSTIAGAYCYTFKFLIDKTSDEWMLVFREAKIISSATKGRKCRE
jgi:hypothetical protein